jgi:hypothetical protein
VSISLAALLALALVAGDAGAEQSAGPVTLAWSAPPDCPGERDVLNRATFLRVPRR